MSAVDIAPVPAGKRTQPAFDLFLIFAGANIVATTLVTGASVAPAGELGLTLGLIAFGSLAGAALVAALAPVGPRLGVPSIIAARAVLGPRGAALLALLLYVTNFAWIALNNLIAASALQRAVGGNVSAYWWTIVLGVAATLVVAAGPRAVGLADRVAVPLMAFIGVALTLRVVTNPVPLAAPTSPGSGMSWHLALDVVMGYQVSWILMFADYSRYTASPRHGVLAVFLGLGLTSLWFMPLGLLAARVAGSGDPGAMAAAALGSAGAGLFALATLTTNFVNIYLSALAWKSLFPRSQDTFSVATIGLVGTALALMPGVGLDRYVEFMVLLGAVLVPVGGVFIAHFVLLRRKVDVAALYDPRGRYSGTGGFRFGALLAWGSGTAVYFMARDFGGTLPALGTAIVVALVVTRLQRDPDG